jgi:hypothetical protein
MPINTLDQVTFLVAVIVVAAKMAWRASLRTDWLVAKNLGKDFLNGALIVPFGVMVAELFSSQLFHLMTETSPLAVALAVAIGLFFIFDELKILD